MSIIIGFHGCDKTVRDKLVNKELSFKKSENNYDWLGDGMYFWDDDAERALEFAKFKSKLPQIGKEGIKTPAVVGAIVDLGQCLDLIKSASLKLLKAAHQILLQEAVNHHIPQKINL